MSVHLIRDLEALKKRVLTLGAMVERSISKALTSLLDRRPELAYEVIEGDAAIDEREVEIEKECMKILALHQPVATDLRFIITVLKVNNDLERMGDHATDIAGRSLFLGREDPIAVPGEFTQMGDRVQAMVRDCLDSLVNLDTELAKRVCDEDDGVDDLHRKLFEIFEDRMRGSPDTITRQMSVLSASRHLERIADLATNISEDVIFNVDGTVVRHRMRPWGKE